MLLFFSRSWGFVWLCFESLFGKALGVCFSERGRFVFLLLMYNPSGVLKKGKLVLVRGNGCFFKLGCLDCGRGISRHVHHLLDDDTPLSMLHRRRKAIPPFVLFHLSVIVYAFPGGVLGPVFGKGLGNGIEGEEFVFFLFTRRKVKKGYGCFLLVMGKEAFPVDVSGIGPDGVGIYVVASRNSTPISRGCLCYVLSCERGAGQSQT